MIRLVQRRLIVPRGDTGTFSIPILAGKDSGDAAIFTVFDPLMHRKIFEKAMTLSDGALNINFTHNDTVNLPVGQYVWDIKFYTDPVIVDGKLVGGTEVDSYYSAFTLPICEIRETGDNLLMSDDAPTGALRPGQVDIITASIREITSLKESAAESAAEADTSATNAESSASAAATSAQDALDSKVAALAAQQTASAASENAISAAANAQASAALAAQRANEVMVELGTKANIEDLAAVAFSGLYSDLSGVPTRVSQFINDVGYLTQHQDISGKANLADLATVAISGSYNDLSNKPTIPDVQINGSSIVDNGVANIPVASDDVLGVVKVHRNGIGTGIKLSSQNVLTVAPAIPSAIKSAALNATGVIIPYYQHQAVFYGLAKAAGDSTQSISTNAVGTYTNAAKEAIQTMLDVPSKADVPTQVSQLTNDAGYITGYTETDPTVPAWAKAAQKPTYTASEVGAPTVQEMNDAIANVNTMKIHICTQGEYNSETGVPTIQNPDTQTFYLVPGGDSNNLFIEWAYVNNAWERFGSADVDLSNYATKSEIPEVPVQDVQINGSSIISSGVANIPVAGSKLGLVRINPALGVTIAADSNPSAIRNCIGIVAATDEEVKTGTINVKPITPASAYKATFYGLAKAAGDTTQSVSTNAVGTYTPEAKEAIQQMLDVPSKSEVQNLISVSTTAPLGEDAKIWIDTDDSTTVQVPTVAEMNLALAEKADIEDIPEVPVQDVQINETSILSNGIANIPTASSSTLGLVKASSAGGIMALNGTIGIIPAGESVIKQGNANYNPIVPKWQHISVFYGLATAAGDTTQKVSTNAVGTYTNEAKAAILNMLGAAASSDIPNVPVQDVQINGTSILNSGIANMPIAQWTTGADDSNLGLVQGIQGFGIAIGVNGVLSIERATSTIIKTGTDEYRPIVPKHQEKAVFYGLATAAGDTTQKVSSNAVGTYTSDAKSAIQAMLGITDALATKLNAAEAGLKVVRLI